MPPAKTIRLSGTLGERHRCLNASVREACQQNTVFKSVEKHPEISPIDRLFKIDLASKQRRVDYIIHTLQDDDMLYVSRALKSLWLLETEYSEMINPVFLEDELFTRMTLQAANKMRHWIQLHLREPNRCEVFYKFYKGRNFGFSAKFLWHCSSEFILNEIGYILEKITPKLLKVLSEKVPQITKIYYDNVRENQVLLNYYLRNDIMFFANLKYLLKSDPDVFFYILENFFVHGKFQPLNCSMTTYIMKHHKTRFLEKPELYTVWFLNMNALVKYLSADEIKELVLKLANAEYLAYWFTYKDIEPLLKGLREEERTSFKKLIFVDQVLGPSVKNWPYTIPNPPVPQNESYCFEDAHLYIIDAPFFYNCDSEEDWVEESVKTESVPRRQKISKNHSFKKILDELFDQFRFLNYNESQKELQKLLVAESSGQIRQCMLLVLVSKTGGRAEYLASLFELLSHFRNEPVHIRASIVRSLVKRAFVWRLAPKYWEQLMKWGQGLGLDGSVPEVPCHEGLHAVIARDLIAGNTPHDLVWQAFLRNFSTLTEYSISTEERGRLSARLPALLLRDAQCNDDETLNRLNLLLDTLTAYRIRFDKLPGIIEAIATAAEEDFESAENLLTCVYDARIGRKQLIKENFEIMQTDASYVNALRHDPSILDETVKFEKLIGKKEFKHEKFLRKLAVYFTEKNGLGQKYNAILKRRAATAPDIKLARPLAMLAGSSFPSLIKDFDVASPKTPKRQLAAALRSNAHVVRPPLDLELFGWCTVGAKAVANRVTTCRPKDTEWYLTQILSWHRMLRLALVLASRVNKDEEVFEIFASRRPCTALMVFPRYVIRGGVCLDLSIWEILKINVLKLHKDQLRRIIEHIPAVIGSGKSNLFLADFCAVIYKACKKNLPDKKIAILSKIPFLLSEIDYQFIYEEIDDFLLNDFKDSEKNSDFLENISTNYGTMNYICLFISIMAKFVVLSVSEEMLAERVEKIGVPFLKNLKLMWKRACGKEVLLIEYFFDKFLLHLKYNKAFFDVKCASCLPVFEMLTEWMHEFLPLEIWFGKYVTVNLTMIYFKTVRLCLKQNPELFSEGNKTHNNLEAQYILGTMFGEFLSNEIEELAQKYFPSITKLYGAEVVNYFTKYIYRDHYNGNISKFTPSVVRGLLKNNSEASRVLAKYIFTENGYGQIDDKDYYDILGTLEGTGSREICFGFIDFY